MVSGQFSSCKLVNTQQFLRSSPSVVHMHFPCPRGCLCQPCHGACHVPKPCPSVTNASVSAAIMEVSQLAGTVKHSIHLILLRLPCMSKIAATCMQNSTIRLDNGMQCKTSYTSATPTLINDQCASDVVARDKPEVLSLQ